MTEGFEEFLRERRERTERTRHLLVSVLAITCIALAVSNVVLALRLTSGRARQSAEPPARATSVPQAARPSGVTEPPARESTTSARTATDEAPPAVTLPKTGEVSVRITTLGLPRRESSAARAAGTRGRGAAGGRGAPVRCGRLASASARRADAHAARRSPARDDARAIGAARTDRRAGARSARGSHRRVDADDVWARRRRGARAGRARVLRREVGRRPILASGTRSHRHRTLNHARSRWCNRGQ